MDKACKKSSRRTRIRFYYYSSVTSTNDVIDELYLKGKKQGTCVLAESQTNGRGRLGRDFISERGNIYMSILLKPTETLPPSYYTEAAAVAVCRVCDKILPYKTDIKWVNDVLYKGKKLCGILTVGKNGYVTVGIGVNAVMTKRLKAELADTATALGEHTDRKINIKKLAKKIAKTFMRLYEKGGFHGEYVKRSVVLGKNITYETNEGVISDRAVAITDEGHLVTESGKVLKSGQVSVRI